MNNFFTDRLTFFVFTSVDNVKIRCTMSLLYTQAATKDSYTIFTFTPVRHRKAKKKPTSIKMTPFMCLHSLCGVKCHQTDAICVSVCVSIEDVSGHHIKWA